MVFLLRPKRRERTRRHSRTRMCDFQHNPPKREKERKENDIPSSSFSHLSLFENSGPFPVILTKSCVNSRRGHIERANISFILVCLEEKWRGYGKCNVGWSWSRIPGLTTPAISSVMLKCSHYQRWSVSMLMFNRYNVLPYSLVMPTFDNYQ